MRAIAREAALAEAAKAEGTLAQLAGLAERTRLLAAEYAARDDAGDAHALAGAMRFAAGMQGLTRNAAAEAETARSVADGKARAAAEAERRRAAVDDRASREIRTIARKGYATSLSLAPRKGGWHGS